jgi:molybdopterin/thiamine biosynthesis adenylyltransferase
MKDEIRVVNCYEVPESAQALGHRDASTAYRLLPNNPSDAYYAERIDRNIGWITREEQNMLRQTVIGVAGCGGMGAQLAEKFLRLGIGEVRIADSEMFDVSNINRQFAANKHTIGKSKAFETARMLRAIADDTTIVVYPHGISEHTAESFVAGCDVVCDEIEFWCAAARIALHQNARSLGVPVFVANTVGFGSHVFLFTPSSATMEECLGMSYGEALAWEDRAASGTMIEADLIHFMERVAHGLVCEWPEYCADYAHGNRVYTRHRLIRERRAAIIATNPALACGFVADRVLLHLLQASTTKRTIEEMPVAPGYLYLDAATMTAKVVRGGS